MHTALVGSSAQPLFYATCMQSSLNVKFPWFVSSFTDCILHIQQLHFDALCKSSGGSTARSPVLMTLWMTFATWPLRRELSSLTSSSRQVQRTAIEPARRIRPTLRSDSSVDTNKCLPAEWQDQKWLGYYSQTPSLITFFSMNTKKKMYTKYNQDDCAIHKSGWLSDNKFELTLQWRLGHAMTGTTVFSAHIANGLKRKTDSQTEGRKDIKKTQRKGKKSKGRQKEIKRTEGKREAAAMMKDKLATRSAAFTDSFWCQCDIIVCMCRRQQWRKNITKTRSVWHHSFTRLLFLMSSCPMAIPVITHLSSWGWKENFFSSSKFREREAEVLNL